MTRYKLIVNPVAGRGAAAHAAPLIERALRDHQLEFDLVRTESPWHAAEMAQQAVADAFDVVVAVGGDGTANEVLNGLMQAKQAGEGSAAMGVLCVGRGNDFAFGVGIPRDAVRSRRVKGGGLTLDESWVACTRRVATLVTAWELGSIQLSALWRKR